MRAESLEKVIRAVGAKEDKLSMKLRAIVAQLNTLSETMSLWNGHLARAENEMKIMLQSGIDGSELMHLIKQKKALSNYIYQLSGQITELRNDFEKLASQVKQEKNKKKFLEKKLKKQNTERKRSIERLFELDIIEQWQMKK
ncbi:MAG: hypothetical protein ACLFSQ_10840 [Candidatus Zixiibacteriota bacterium]